ncbi:MAG: dihydroorotate dehydrogenase electron transfer subunit [Bacteroidota bacterium]
MKQLLCEVRGVREVAANIFVLSFLSSETSTAVLPGQFLNIKVDGGSDPLLRRPFSVYRTSDETVEIIFNVVGKGTHLLSKKRPGDLLDVLGPLGVPFNLEPDSFETGILVGGGLGVAPLPITMSGLKVAGKPVITCLGARTAGQLVMEHLDNVQVATDDGSRGHHGNVVDLLKQIIADRRPDRPKMFGCGPTPMLRALAEFALSAGIPCEVSLEGPMACGFGICQGCPVELSGDEGGYALMCKEGPAFDVRTIRL